MDGRQYSEQNHSLNADRGHEMTPNSGQSEETSDAKRPEHNFKVTSDTNEEGSLGSFEMISGDFIPAQGSEDLLMMNNGPVTGVAYLQHLSRQYIQGLSEIQVPNTGFLEYVGTFFRGPYICAEEVDEAVIKFLNEGLTSTNGPGQTLNSEMRRRKTQHPITVFTVCS